MPPQSPKKSWAVACTHRKVLAWSACQSESDPPYRTSQCSLSSPVYLSEHLSACMSSLSRSQVPRCSPAKCQIRVSCWNQSSSPSFWCLLEGDSAHSSRQSMMTFLYSVFPFWHTSNIGSLLRELLGVATVHGLCEVWCVQGKEERWEDCSLGGVLCCRSQHQTYKGEKQVVKVRVRAREMNVVLVAVSGCAGSGNWGGEEVEVGTVSNLLYRFSLLA